MRNEKGKNFWLYGYIKPIIDKPEAGIKFNHIVSCINDYLSDSINSYSIHTHSGKAIHNHLYAGILLLTLLG